MNTVTLGKTGITVNKNGFGALPIQRISREEAAALLRKAYQNGITFFDTARFYTDSEEKIGYALTEDGEPDVGHIHCAMMAEIALKRALADYGERFRR